MSDELKPESTAAVDAMTELLAPRIWEVFDTAVEQLHDTFILQGGSYFFSGDGADLAVGLSFGENELVGDRELPSIKIVDFMLRSTDCISVHEMSDEIDKLESDMAEVIKRLRMALALPIWEEDRK